ncbi:HAD-IIB family hydrolase [Chitinophaga sp. Cy-1792]|uniref:HAD-IIB family hydrolase n=1 Tax=Chitinophaga sp. Cy-1792 TaxID=2608339 RepID=UPI001420CAF0|nr:HAD-IIB family hydrolase [Chitinophaga sp. Cy-1792]NIG52778.1 HAD-IIB family hydrolase [Chitinophaga sp. Cy-1792]
MLLATDLDGTFLGGTDNDRKILYDLVRNNNDIKLVFVTGRGVAGVFDLLDSSDWLPRPEYIICDVGCTVTHYESKQPVAAIQQQIAALWPGDHIREELKVVNGLLHLDSHQQYRCSYFYDENTDFAHASQMAEQLACDILLSDGKYLDFLPKGVNKGFSVLKLTQYLQIPREKVLVAGDTMNDYSMFAAGFNGVVVGESEAELVRSTAGMPHVLQSIQPGAGGILEALGKFPELAAVLGNSTLK